jgi:hypothetical protein
MNPQTERAGRYHTDARWALLLAATGLMIATPIATWWLVGDQSATAKGADLDYAVRPVELDPAVERLVGAGSVVIIAITLPLLIRAARMRRFDVRWWSVLVPVLVAGAIVGAGWRVVTAGVVGANIGAGLVFLFGGPVVVALLVWAVFRSLYLLLSAPRSVT